MFFFLLPLLITMPLMGMQSQVAAPEKPLLTQEELEGAIKLSYASRNSASFLRYFFEKKCEAVPYSKELYDDRSSFLFMFLRDLRFNLEKYVLNSCYPERKTQLKSLLSKMSIPLAVLDFSCANSSPYAGKDSSPELLQVLLEYGAVVTNPDSDGNTPLVILVKRAISRLGSSYYDDQTIEFLLKNGASLDDKIINDKGRVSSIRSYLGSQKSSLENNPWAETCSSLCMGASFCKWLLRVAEVIEEQKKRELAQKKN